ASINVSPSAPRETPILSSSASSIIRATSAADRWFTLSVGTLVITTPHASKQEPFGVAHPQQPWLPPRPNRKHRPYTAAHQPLPHFWAAAGRRSSSAIPMLEPKRCRLQHKRSPRRWRPEDRLEPQLNCWRRLPCASRRAIPAAARICRASHRAWD